MSNFNLPFGVYVAGADPIDAERYVAPDIAARDALITNGRAGNGQQVWVESEKKLYVLEDVTGPTWTEVGAGGVVAPPGTLIRQYSFEVDFNASGNWFFADQVFPFPNFELIEFIGSFSTIQIVANRSSGGTGGTGKFILNSDLTFGELNFVTLDAGDGTSMLIINAEGRPQTTGPTGSNIQSVEFVKGSLSGVLSNVKINMYQ